jgi:hypothetical protein
MKGREEGRQARKKGRKGEKEERERGIVNGQNK